MCVTDALEIATVLTKAAPHDLKIAQYRDRILALLVNTVTTEDFMVFEAESADWLGKINENTEIAIYGDFQAYATCCLACDVLPLPIVAHTVDFYLSRLLALGRRRATLDRHLASLVRWCDWLGYDDPRKLLKIKKRVAEIRKNTNKSQRQAEGLREFHLTDAMNLLNAEKPRDCLDVVLLFVAYQTLARESELVNFDWEDLSLDADGSGLLHLQQSKTDQDAEGDYLYLSRATMGVLAVWQNKLGRTTGAIFCGVHSNGRVNERLSVRGVQRSFKRTAALLGFDPSVFSGHSTRVGAAQDMVERDFDMATVMLSGRWKSVGMLLKYTKRIRAKKSGAARMSEELGWDNRPSHIEIPNKLMGVLPRKPLDKY